MAKFKWVVADSGNKIIKVKNSQKYALRFMTIDVKNKSGKGFHKVLKPELKLLRIKSKYFFKDENLRNQPRG